ncbi:MAG: hypothetical protein IT212_07455 [Bacteroidia bacterium]|nr:hypothetical protein [Bacteroidia bacterium]
MKPEIRHYGIIRGAKRIYYNPELHTRQMQDLDGKEFEEVIKEKHVKPSTSTHGYYRGGIISSCLTTNEFAGWDKEEVNDYFCGLFLKRVVEKIFPDGKRVEVIHIGSTGDLNQREMNEFIETVVRYLAEKGIYILSPDEYNLTKYRIIKK